MAAPVLYPGNHLEGATLSATGQTAAGPVEMLRDWDIGLDYEDSGNAGNRDIISDRGADFLSQPVKALLIPGGHNLSGQSCSLAWSDDAAAYTIVDTFVPVGSGAILRVQAATLDKRAWRLRIASPAAAPHLAELVLTEAYVLPSAPLFDTSDEGVDANVVDFTSRGAAHFGSRLAPGQWSALWYFNPFSPQEKQGLYDAYALAWEGARHLFITDHGGVIRWAQWRNRSIRFKPWVQSQAILNTPLDFLEEPS